MLTNVESIGVNESGDNTTNGDDTHHRPPDVRSIGRRRDDEGYVFSDHALYIPEFRNRIKGGDFAGAMRMINEKKVYPLKEGLDVVVVEVVQGGIVRFRLRSTPVGFLTIKGTHYTAVEAIQP